MIPARAICLKLCYTVAQVERGRAGSPCRRNGRRTVAPEGNPTRVRVPRAGHRNRGNAHAHGGGFHGQGRCEGMGNLVFDFQAGHEEEGQHSGHAKRFLNVPAGVAVREVLTIYPSFVAGGAGSPSSWSTGELYSAVTWTLMRQRNLSAPARRRAVAGWRRSSVRW